MSLLGLSLDCDAEHQRGRAVVHLRLQPEAPVDVVVPIPVVHRPLALVSVAEAPAADVLSAAVVVRDDVVLPVLRIATGADPRDQTHLRAGGARRLAAAAAAA